MTITWGRHPATGWRLVGVLRTNQGTVRIGFGRTYVTIRKAAR
jgi:hypothetical protein